MNNPNILRGVLVLLIVFVAFFVKPAKAIDLEKYYNCLLYTSDAADD